MENAYQHCAYQSHPLSLLWSQEGHGSTPHLSGVLRRAVLCSHTEDQVRSADLFPRNSNSDSDLRCFLSSATVTKASGKAIYIFVDLWGDCQRCQCFSLTTPHCLLLKNFHVPGKTFLRLTLSSSFGYVLMRSKTAPYDRGAWPHHHSKLWGNCGCMQSSPSAQFSMPTIHLFWEW